MLGDPTINREKLHYFELFFIFEKLCFVLFQATAKMPLQKPKSAKRKAKEAKYLARRIALSDVDINTVPSHLDDVPQVPNGHLDAQMSSNHEENVQRISKGHRTYKRNLAERGIAGKTGEEVQAIIDEVVSNGPGAIPNDIKAVPSIKGAKSGYKGVCKTLRGKNSCQNNSDTFRIGYGVFGVNAIKYQPIRHSMKGWSLEDIGRAYVYCKELIFSERSGIGSGALFLLQKRTKTVIYIDRKKTGR